MKQIFSIIPHKHFFLKLDKRERFAFQTAVLTGGLLITQLIWEDYRFIMVGVLSVLSYLLTVFSLSEDIKGIEWVLLFILSVTFTASVSLFYFLLPDRWIIRLVVTALFAVGTYAGLLVENIYNVAAERSIQLLRVAQSVGLLLSLVIIFLSANIIFSLRLYFWQNMLFFIPIIFILCLQSIWSVDLGEKLTKKILIYSGVVSWGIGEMAAVLSFWPIQIATGSLLITAGFYTMVGILHQYFSGRLFINTIKEYILVIIFTLCILIITTRWS